MPALVDPFLDEHRVPDMEDLSRIEVAPDSVRDVGRDVADMISLLPDLDDWMDATAAVPPAERSRLNETLTELPLPPPAVPPPQLQGGPLAVRLDTAPQRVEPASHAQPTAPVAGNEDIRMHPVPDESDHDL
eukprot:2852677-Pyramimonas_sp.AAC.1